MTSSSYLARRLSRRGSLPGPFEFWSSYADGPGPAKFMDWLSEKPLEWHQRRDYIPLLYAELSPSVGCRDLKGRSIVRLSNGEYSVGSNCFFPKRWRRARRCPASRGFRGLYGRQEQTSAGEREREFLEDDSASARLARRSRSRRF